MANSGSTWGWCLLEGIKNFQTWILWEANQLPHPLGYLSFAEITFSENILTTIKIMDLYQYKLLPTQSYWSNIFSSLECTWISKLFYNILFFWKHKTNLILLLISPWTQIKQLSSHASPPILLSVGIKLSNRFLFSNF